MVVFISILALALAACAPAAPAQPAAGLRVLATLSFLGDLTRQVAGERAVVETLIADGLDPHAFTPAPADLARIAESQVLVVNGAGLEEWLEDTLNSAGGERLLIEAAAGLESRTPQEGEHAGEEHDEDVGDPEEGHHHEGDPHFWLDPVLVIRYVENIRDGLIQADPGGAEEYTRNAAAYIAELQELDGWIHSQVEQIAPEKRLIVTNHESFGYFADRYGFRVIGTIIPSVSTGAAPSAQQLARLIDDIRANQVSVIFLETGANPKLAEQIATETGVTVVSGLLTHSLTDASGPASSYIEMMRYNTSKIVDALR